MLYIPCLYSRQWSIRTYVTLPPLIFQSHLHKCTQADKILFLVDREKMACIARLSVAKRWFFFYNSDTLHLTVFPQQGSLNIANTMPSLLTPFICAVNPTFSCNPRSTTATTTLSSDARSYSSSESIGVCGDDVGVLAETLQKQPHFLHQCWHALPQLSDCNNYAQRLKALDQCKWKISTALYVVFSSPWAIKLSLFVKALISPSRKFLSAFLGWQKV